MPAFKQDNYPSYSQSYNEGSSEKYGLKRPNVAKNEKKRAPGLLVDYFQVYVPYYP